MDGEYHQPHGLHARPRLIIVNTLRRQEAQVTVRKNDPMTDATSILDRMCLGAAPGTELVLAAKGPAASQALHALGRLFEKKFEMFLKG